MNTKRQTVLGTGSNLFWFLRSTLMQSLAGCWAPISALGMHAQNYFWDRRLGIRTYGLCHGGWESGAHHDGWSYQPMNYRRLNLILRQLRLSPDDVFMDVGCGMGRAVCRAAVEPIRRAIGVEIDPVLADQARANAARLRHRRAEVEIICADATTVPLDGVAAYFFFHPFG